MKKIILFSISLFISAWTLSAQQTLFVIDNVTVENFDGSQLKDKIVRDYKITTQGSGRNAVTVHSITTAPSVFSFTGSFSPMEPFVLPDSLNVFMPVQKQTVYVIDDETYENAMFFNTLFPADIENITVFKEGSPEQKKYVEKYGKDVTVIKVSTNKNKTDWSSFLEVPDVTVVTEYVTIRKDGQVITGPIVPKELTAADLAVPSVTE